MAWSSWFTSSSSSSSSSSKSTNAEKAQTSCDPKNSKKPTNANNIPYNLANSRYHPDQQNNLDTTRVTSSIPIGDTRPRHQRLPSSSSPSSSNDASTSSSTSSCPHSSSSPGGSTWVYPSPQQFYNALKRKGFYPDERDMNAYVITHTRQIEWTHLCNCSYFLLEC